MSIHEIKNCRVCKSSNLDAAIDLGVMELTGVFPKTVNEEIISGPLILMLCRDCGLLQASHSYPLDLMYGDNYGYRSGLNPNMVSHLQQKIKQLVSLRPVEAGDIVLDIGANDGTTLNSYRVPGLRRIGMDPTGAKFRQYYDEGIELIPDFFSAVDFRKLCGEAVKIVTSISMFYDLEDPAKFAQDIYDILDADGIWHFEQNYMPTMLRNNAYDMISHEHLEHYSLTVTKRILDSVGFKIIDVSVNDVNGGSFAVTCAKKDSGHQPNAVQINWMLKQEKELNVASLDTYAGFQANVLQHKSKLFELLNDIKDAGKTVLGYGASTRGNTILQYCNITPDLLPAIADVNADKFGSLTPATHIPIISEEKAFADNPDYFLVLPWHYRNSVLRKHKDYLNGGGHFIFPLPNIEII